MHFFPGTAGTPGAVWRIGTTTPTTDIGRDGDFFIVTPTGDIYEKAGGNYLLKGNIRGPAGPTGPVSTVPGPPGPQGEVGPQGPVTTVRAVTLYLSAPTVIPDATDTDVLWTGAVFDNGPFYANLLPDRLVVPVGVTRVRLSAGIRWLDNTSGNRKVRIRGNGGAPYEPNAIVAAAEHPTGALGDCTITTGIIPVVAGNFFNVSVTQDSGGPLGLRHDVVIGARGCYFCMEVIP
jgi:hypothetical protein